MAELHLPRPASSPTVGPLDGQFWDLIESDFRHTLKQHPILATYVGIHDSDDRLDDGTRDAVVQEICELHAQGRPVLVGTRSIDKSEHLSQLLVAQQVELASVT